MAVAISPGSFQHFTIFVIELMEVQITTQQMIIGHVLKDDVDLIVLYLFTGKQGVVQAVRHLERRV